MKSFLGFIFVLLFFSFVCADTWYISPFGNNQNSGTSPSSAFFDLQTALGFASSGDTISAASGYYSGSSNIYLTLNGITLIGARGSLLTTFQGQNNDRMNYIFRLTNGASIQGITLSTAQSGIELATSSNLNDISITDMEDSGINPVSGSVSINMTDITFSSCMNGISALDSPIEKITLDNGYFVNCTYGIYVGGNSDVNTLTVSNSNFDGVAVKTTRAISFAVSGSAGAIVISVSNSIISGFDYSSYGSGIYFSATQGELLIDSVIFRNLTCSYGCGIYVTGEINTSVENGTFENNHGSFGGGFYGSSESPISITNSLFSSNSAISGGGISISSNSEANALSIINCTFQNNVASSDGGGIYTTESISIDSCEFITNNAESDGGAIYTTKLITITDVTFDSNTATDTGGAIYYSGSDDYTSTIEECTFLSNSANIGGAVSQVNGVLLLQHVHLSGNSASTQGGAIYTNAALNLISSTILNNAANNGAGLYIDDYPSSVNIKFASFEENTAQQNGGGFDCYGNAGIFLNVANFKSNKATTGEAFNCGDCSVTQNVVIVNDNNASAC